MPDPAWTTPARLNGLRPKTWKKREGVTRDGSLAEMIEIWLQLPDQEKQNCEIGWGPNDQGHHGTMSGGTIARYVERHKLPPQMATRYQNAEAALRQLLRLPQADICDPNAILRTPPTTPSQYARVLAAKNEKDPPPG